MIVKQDQELSFEEFVYLVLLFAVAVTFALDKINVHLSGILGAEIAINEQLILVKADKLAVILLQVVALPFDNRHELHLACTGTAV